MASFTAAVVEAAAETEAPIWLASVVIDDVAELTVLPRVNTTEAAGLVPAGRGEPAAPPDPPSPLGAPPDGAAGEPGAPVKVAGAISVTCPTGALPERGPLFVPPTDEGPAEPGASASKPPGAAKPVDAAPEVSTPPPGRDFPCRPWAPTCDRWC